MRDGTLPADQIEWWIGDIHNSGDLSARQEADIRRALEAAYAAGQAQVAARLEMLVKQWRQQFITASLECDEHAGKEPAREGMWRARANAYADCADELAAVADRREGD